MSQKSTIRTGSNSKGEGKFFNVHLVDGGGEQRANMWKTDIDNSLMFWKLIRFVVHVFLYVRCPHAGLCDVTSPSNALQVY